MTDAELLDEFEQLIVANATTKAWGAAVSARGERIAAIRTRLKYRLSLVAQAAFKDAVGGKPKMSRACSRAKSDVTPCYVKDGDLAEAFATVGWGSGVRKICVGCEYGVGLLREERQAYLADQTAAGKCHD